MTIPRLRILHVIDSLWGGGAEVSMAAYLRADGAHPNREHHLVALRGDGPTRDAASRLGIDTTLGPPGVRPRWSDIALIRDAVRRTRPDVVHCVLQRSTQATALALARSPTPMVVTLTSVAYEVEDRSGSIKRRVGTRLFHALHGIALRRHRVTIRAVSQPVADRACEIFGIDPTVVTVVPDLRTDPRELVTRSRAQVRRELSIPETAPVLISVGREHPVKDHVTLLDAAALLRTEIPDLRIVLAGPPGPAGPDIDAAITGHGLERTVVRLGYRDDVPDLLAASDLFVSASISEGLGAAVVEALGSGLPVVAVDNPGIREVLGADHPGMVPPRNAQALVSATSRLLADSDLRHRIGVEGRARFDRLFEMEANIDRIADVFRAAVRRAGG
jgi:glycosyltransferase involved in cell wall biosynthesis